LRASPPNLLAGRDAVEHIVRDGRDAGEVIRGLRSLFRRTPLEKAEFDLGQIVAELATLLRSRAEKDDVSLEIDIAPDLPLIMGDRIQVQQVLMNLVANGIEAMQNVSHQSRSLAIRAHRDGAAVLTEVEDCGSGATNFDTIFEPFFTTKAKGMGMGLSICQSIVEAHNGKIWAGPGIRGGAVFRFTLPHIAESGQ
jgi:C4-dicarboxylate-specific signal transduction histidine kinase